MTLPEHRCAHCAAPIENKTEPTWTGSAPKQWVHRPGGHSACFPQDGGHSPRAEPGLWHSWPVPQHDTAGNRHDVTLLQTAGGHRVRYIHEPTCWCKQTEQPGKQGE